MCELVGSSGLPGPSRRSNQRSRTGMKASVKRRLVSSSTAESSRSEIPFSSSFRSTGPAMPERSASSSSPAFSRSRRSGLKARARVGLYVAELLAILVDGQHRELRLRRAKRHLLALERDAGREQLVLELVVALDELVREQAALARLPQPEEPLALVDARALLGLVQRLELAAAEEVGVAADDLRLLRGLLLPHAHGPRLLGALVHVLREAALELGGGADGGVERPRHHLGRASRTPHVVVPLRARRASAELVEDGAE